MYYTLGSRIVRDLKVEGSYLKGTICQSADPSEEGLNAIFQGNVLVALETVLAQHQIEAYEKSRTLAREKWGGLVF